LIEDPDEVTPMQAERWASDFDSWGLCDGCCNFVFRKTSFAYDLVREWNSREEQYVKRAAFSLIASLAVHDKRAPDRLFESWFPLIKTASFDERNFVKKAVNWALRQIGKRNLNLNTKAIRLARDIQRIDSRSARWIAADALRELQSEKVKDRLCKRAGRRPSV
jgi:3-methyladenine DNA glycosylase AlkD